MTIDGVPELSADAVIRSGGWHPGYARVLTLEHDEQNAVILIDGNGDGAELELEYWHRGEDGRWHGGSTSGYGPLDALPAIQTWNAGPFVAAVGRALPNKQVSVKYGGRVYGRRASEFGTWGFIHAPDSPDTGEIPALVGESPPVA